MRYIIVNFDKQQFFRPVEPGAPQGSRFIGVAERQDDGSCMWLLLLMRLLEHKEPVSTAGPHQQTLVDKWTGDKIGLLRGDDLSSDFVPETDLALAALAGAQPSSYDHVRAYFKDITNELKKWWPKRLGEEYDSRFVLITQLELPSLLTPEMVGRCVGKARWWGPEFQLAYITWLSSRPGINAEVREVLGVLATALTAPCGPLSP